MLGLPDRISACLFDLDGVLTPTAAVHAAAWKTMFDEFLRARADASGQPFTPFDQHDDYDEYVDGKPRLAGVRDFLASRGIVLPDSEAEALGTRKNELVLELLHTRGVEPYEGSLRYLHAVRDAGLRRAVVSASTHCAQILQAAGIADLIEERVDGVVAKEEKLRGKPEPDTFLAAARRLGVPPDAAAVFEDALAGVAAGHAGHFGYVIGVDRVGEAAELAAHGADAVVKDLDELVTSS
jgi:beta-phosphoglucomutase family hydrolase